MKKRTDNYWQRIRVTFSTCMALVLSLMAFAGVPKFASGQQINQFLLSETSLTTTTSTLNSPESGKFVRAPAAPPDPRLVDLSVSIYKPVTSANDRAPYEDLFKQFADAIYEMTNGKHKIRNVVIYDNGRFFDRADIQWIQIEPSPRATTNAYGKGNGRVYMGDRLFSDKWITDSIGYYVPSLAHEWGHYFYGMFDEYKGGAASSSDPTDPVATDLPPEPCSVMCASNGTIDFAKLNFSTRKSTVDAGRTSTANYRAYQTYGWEALVRSANNDPEALRGKRLYWPELASVAPAASDFAAVELPAQQADARGALNIVWVDSSQSATKQRMILVNTSSDMGENKKLDSAKAALKSYVDTSNTNDMLGIITFDESFTVVQPLTAISGDNKEEIKGKIDAISASTTSNNRNVAGADTAAINALKAVAGTGYIVDRNIYVITDGAFNDSTDPHIFQKLYNDHRAAGIPISIFNFTGASKTNDVFSNAIDFVSFPTRATTPNGTYNVISTDGFTVPTFLGNRPGAVNATNGSAGNLGQWLDEADQQYSPMVDVNLSAAGPIMVQTGQTFTASIFVDPSLEDFDVDVTLVGTTSATNLQLLMPDGSAGPAPVCESDDVETYCVFSKSMPASGLWTLRVSGYSADIQLDYRATGYTSEGSTYEASLEARGGSIVTYPNNVVLEARLGREQDVAQANVTGWVKRPDGSVTSIVFKDDGVMPDESANDGLYTSLLPYNAGGAYEVTAQFDNSSGTAVFTQQGQSDGESATTPVGENFVRFAKEQIIVQGYANDDHGNDSSHATVLPTTNNDVAGRIDMAGDVDVFKVTSPTTSTSAGPSIFILRLGHFAFDMNASVRVTTSSGAKTYTTGSRGFGQYWSIPVMLGAGDTVYVEVQHANSQAMQGSYDISFGEPLPGELAGRVWHLPLISK